MKVAEVREKLKSRKKDELQKLIVEMYKQFPKKVRETKEIDNLIDNPDLFKTRKQNSKKAVQMPDLLSVEYKVKRFLENARAQNYIAPNRVIPKKERSNWRFTAKRLVDQLTVLSGQSEHVKACAYYLEEIYKLFCYASGHYVFASQEPFHTIRLPQPDFYNRVVSLKKQVEEPDTWIRESMLLILEHDHDHDILTISLSEVLLANLHNAPLKERAVSIAQHLVQEKEAEVSKEGHINRKFIKYWDKEYINDLVEMILMIQSALGEYKAANAFFKKHYMATAGEVKLYVLLKNIMRYERVDDWLREYESALKRGIRPRDSLQDTTDYIRRENEFPRFIRSYE
ncbi:hypothetical protein GCM10007063_12540 [Lentibacillus kapialis]|uniref:Uncharacterized protein n=1 Tax=Lentibacillus kapialis TaxID=340214 RepID=A0A917UWW0_9BACI|nr:hypothetical protein [Lentibacillus kapialis]GGJ91380.1 hypothetical protein GCM10007063_12540 [Lentibacillus kapialis]